MKEVIKYDLEYRVDGDKHFKHLEIDFVPDGRRKEFNKQLSIADDVRSKWDRISDIQTLLVGEKDKEKIRKLKDEEKACCDYIMSFSDMDVIKMRFDIIKKVLVKNGYANDKDLMSFEWWDNNVDPYDINELLRLCVFKDIDKKKRH